jgi:hypothetical protein
VTKRDDISTVTTLLLAAPGCRGGGARHGHVQQRHDDAAMRGGQQVAVLGLELGQAAAPSGPGGDGCCCMPSRRRKGMWSIGVCTLIAAI